uniref:Uncharacterized protein n=2 Tax=Triticum TaxID=4564 RepID=A0A8R7RDP0_TRIUA
MRPCQEVQAALPRSAVQGDAYLLQHKPLQGVRTEAVFEAQVPRGPRARVRVARGSRRRREEGRRQLLARRAEDQGRRWVGAAAVDPEFQDVLNSLKLKIVAGICNDVPPVHRQQLQRGLPAWSARRGRSEDQAGQRGEDQAGAEAA